MQVHGVDISIRMTELTTTEIAAWARLLRTSRMLLDGAEADLKAAGLPPLGWYDVLLELKRAGDAGLRPVALQEALLLAQYGLSRLLDRMETAGLIARDPCPEDGRGQVVTLTPAGRTMLERMWPVYREAIATRFSSRLEDGEAAMLARIFSRLSDTG